MAAQTLRDRFYKRMVVELQAQLPATDGEGSIARILGVADDVAYIRSHLEQMADGMAQHLTAEVEHLAGILVPDKYRPAVLDVRDDADPLVTGWPFPRHPWPPAVLGDHPWNVRLEFLPWQGGNVWPAEASAKDVATWLRKAAKGNDAAERLAETLELGLRLDPKPHPNIPPNGPRGFDYLTQTFEANDDDVEFYLRPRWPAIGVALLFVATAEFLDDLQRPKIALDASQTHHGLLTGWQSSLGKKAPIHQEEPEVVRDADGELSISIWHPDRPTQLILPLGDETLSEGTIRAIREIASYEGVRNWLAFLRLLSVEGNRTGWIRWTLDQHLEALGYAATKRRNPAARDKTSRIMSTLTKLRLVVQGRETKGRQIERPLVLVGEYTKEQTAPGQTRIEGMRLTINPLLWKGVSPEEGKIGRNWWPVPVELAQLDHHHHPYAVILGPIIGIRNRWDIADGRDHTAFRGDKLLQAAGIPFNSGNPQRAWKSVARDLDELCRIKQLRRWAWDNDRPGLDNVLRAWWHPSCSDPFKHHLPPSVYRPPQQPTGADLREWRTQRKLTQEAAARLLRVTRWTVLRAEQAADAPLSRSLAAAFVRVASGDV